MKSALPGCLLLLLATGLFAETAPSKSGTAVMRAADSRVIRQAIEQEKDVVKLRRLATEQVITAEQATAEAKRLADQVKSLNAEAARLQAEADRLKADKARLERETEQLRAAAAQLRSEGGALAERNAQLQADSQRLAKERTEFAILTEKARTESQHLTQANNELAARNRELQAAVDAFRQEKANLGTDVVQLRSDIAGLEDQKKKKETELAEAEARLKLFTTGLIGLILTNGLTVYTLFSGRRKARLEEEQMRLTSEKMALENQQLRQKLASGKPA